ncbi:MAG TPA: (2Fe-2S)-binding protein [Nitrospirae bacterium]|nr:(2Fe-2S)-binding protein [Nitrospirota bacterium]
MNKPANASEIIDNIKVICQCKMIKKAAYKKLIAQGMDSIAELEKATGAGSGECGGKRCGPRLREMLNNPG